MKKFVSLLLVFAVVAAVVCAFAVNVSAEGESQTDDPGITWELSEDGKTLTFTGKGAMPNYNNSTYRDRPWAKAAETVTAVQVNPGITTLGNFAFCLFEKMTSVTIPDSVTSIGVSAFDHCESLTSVTIPSGVTNIGNNAFHSCSSLESVTIPSGVTSIGKSVFGNCSSLTSVMILYGVTSIGSFAFANCTSLESVTIPSSVTGIGTYAFDHCTSLTSITIPYGVKSIDNNAFQFCTNLESVSFPSSITNIGNGVFQFCSNLTSVTFKAKTPPTWPELPQLINRGAKFTVYFPDGTSEDYNNGAWGDLISQEKAKEAYVVDDQPEKNGTIVLDKDCFPKETYTAANQTVTVTVMPAGGYQLKADSLSVVAENGEAIALTQDETDPMKYTFTMPCSNVTVKAEFEAATGDAEGSILSGGNLWIILAGAVVLVGVIAALVVVKKKKKPAVAGGEKE